MNLILLADMSLLMTVLSDIKILILTSFVVTYHIECAMEGLKYLPLATNSPESMTSASSGTASVTLYHDHYLVVVFQYRTAATRSIESVPLLF